MMNRRSGDGSTELDAALTMGTNLSLIDRAGEQARLRERLNIIVPPILMLMFGISVVCLFAARLLSVQSDLEEARVKFDAQRSAIAVSQETNVQELSRDRTIVRFICGELAYADMRRVRLYQAETIIERQRPNPYFVARDHDFVQLEAHALARQKACATLVGTNLK